MASVPPRSTLGTSVRCSSGWSVKPADGPDPRPSADGTRGWSGRRPHAVPPPLRSVFLDLGDRGEDEGSQRFLDRSKHAAGVNGEVRVVTGEVVQRPDEDGQRLLDSDGQ